MLWALGRLGAEEACRSSGELFFCAQRVELAEVAARQVAGPEFLDARRGASPVELLLIAQNAATVCRDMAKYQLLMLCCVRIFRT